MAISSNRFAMRLKEGALKVQVHFSLTIIIRVQCTDDRYVCSLLTVVPYLFCAFQLEVDFTITRSLEHAIQTHQHLVFL